MCWCMFPVAANFIRLGKLKVSSHEMSITEFTGNVHEFPASAKDEDRQQERSALSKDARDTNAEQEDTLHVECTLFFTC